MIRSYEDVMEEAIKRMKMLKMHENTIEDLKNGVLNMSEIKGYLYWPDEEQMRIIEDFEKAGNKKAYHVIHSVTNIGELFNILYVDYDDEEWELEEEDLQEGQALSYVFNKTYPDCSEYGSIGIKPSIGGLIRVW